MGEHEVPAPAASHLGTGASRPRRRFSSGNHPGCHHRGLRNTPRISTEFQLSPGASGPQEIVTVTTCFRALETVPESTVVRRRISALDGTGLEADSGDPVTLLKGESGPFSQAALEAFHSRALAELEARKGVYYEIADLFVP